MKQTVCLNMIIKNESKAIKRCLVSVKRFIDYWVIVDTGSTDGTDSIIKELLEGLPGEIHHRAWRDFAYNRNEALQLARNKGDYLLFIDADEELKFDEAFVRPLLDKDAYYLTTVLPNHVVIYRMSLVNNHLDWVWEGVLHEVLYSTKTGRSCAILPGVVNQATNQDGQRSQDPKKYHHDARILEIELKRDPQNSRTVFFLAQSYYQAKNYRKSLKAYQKRSIMGGFEEEVYFSLYMTARLQEKLKMAPKTFIAGYQKAFAFRPSRAEPLYWIANHYHRIGRYEDAYLILKEALSIPCPSDSINIERDIYEYGLLFLWIDSARKLKKETEAQEGYDRLSHERRALFDQLTAPKDSR